MLFGLEGKIILDRSLDGARGEINGGGFRQSNVNSAAVAGHHIITARAIALISDAAAGGVDCDLGSGNIGELHRAAGGCDIYIPAAHIGKDHRSSHAVYMHM